MSAPDMPVVDNDLSLTIERMNAMIDEMNVEMDAKDTPTLINLGMNQAKKLDGDGIADLGHFAGCVGFILLRDDGAFACHVSPATPYIAIDGLYKMLGDVRRTGTRSFIFLARHDVDKLMNELFVKLLLCIAKLNGADPEVVPYEAIGGSRISAVVEGGKLTHRVESLYHLRTHFRRSSRETRRRTSPDSPHRPHRRPVRRQDDGPGRAR